MCRELQLSRPECLRLRLRMEEDVEFRRRRLAEEGRWTSQDGQVILYRFRFPVCVDRLIRIIAQLLEGLALLENQLSLCMRGAG